MSTENPLIKNLLEIKNEKQENRRKFLPRVKALWDILDNNVGIDKDFSVSGSLGAIEEEGDNSLSNGRANLAEKNKEFEIHERGFSDFDWNLSEKELQKSKFNCADKLGLRALPPITAEHMVFEWTSEDIAKLTDIIRRWHEATEPRRKHLRDLFAKEKGIFRDETSTSSMDKGGLRPKMYSNRHIYLGDEEITFFEYEWLKNRSAEVHK
jgi:hypothetical protein